MDKDASTSAGGIQRSPRSHFATPRAGRWRKRFMVLGPLFVLLVVVVINSFASPPKLDPSYRLEEPKEQERTQLSSSPSRLLLVDAIKKDEGVLAHTHKINDYAMSLIQLAELPIPNVSKTSPSSSVVPLDDAVRNARSSVLRQALQALLRIKQDNSTNARDFSNSNSNSLTKITHLVHMVWMDDNHPPHVARSVDSFVMCTQGRMEVLFWRGPDVDEMMELVFPAVAPMLKDIIARVVQADLIRYLLIYAFGGVYSDTDVTCLKNPQDWARYTFDDDPRDANVAPRPTNQHLRNASLIVGVEADCSVVGDFNACKAKWYARPLQLCQWTFAAAPGHPALLLVVQGSLLSLYSGGQSRFAKGTEAYGHSVMASAGPAMWTDMLEVYLSRIGVPSLEKLQKLNRPKVINNDVLIVSAAAFSPGNLHIFIYESTVSARALVKHNFAGTWTRR